MLEVVQLEGQLSNTFLISFWSKSSGLQLLLGSFWSQTLSWGKWNSTCYLC